MELTRRWFLGGTVATLAVVAVPVTVKATKLIYRQPFKVKRILEFTACYPEHGRLDVTIVGKQRRNMYCVYGARGTMLRWYAIDPAISWVMTEDEFINFDFKPEGPLRLGDTKEPIDIFTIHEDYDGYQWRAPVFQKFQVFDNVTQVDEPLALE